jgi:23S rRNA (cytidine2498-2'-O)-methyltransferase
MSRTANAQSTTLLGYCRAGFEADLISEWRAASDATMVSKPVAGADFVTATFSGTSAKHAERILRMPPIFARSIFVTHADVRTLDARDRVTPLVQYAREFLQERGVQRVCEVWVEYPDTNEGKTLSRLAQALETRVSEQLREDGVLAESALHRLHIFLTAKEQAFVGIAHVHAPASSQWRLGIPRLRVPRDAPSRSTAKLAEAIHVFLGNAEEKLLKPEMRAVDLGAAPGGWTWQLVHRGLHVTAVDNGLMKGDMVDNALVRHLREDGFRFQPKNPVDWMVCDIVASPSRIATLVGQWLQRGQARHTIFNLKLPMKKRFEEVMRCQAIIEEALGDRRDRHELRFKHLYHDREEITAYAGLIPRASRRT